VLQVEQHALTLRWGPTFGAQQDLYPGPLPAAAGLGASRVCGRQTREQNQGQELATTHETHDSRSPRRTRLSMGTSRTKDSVYTELMSSISETTAAGPVNYESAPLVELEIDDTQYRVDAGKQGTALCISTRKAGSWDWSFGGEARWDVRSLRSKAFERAVLGPLSAALAEALSDSD
jgi:hypothetical protein